MKIYTATVAWSSSNWRGIMDEKGYQNDIKRSSWGYVKESKIAHEWWNFFEGFNPRFYYGILPVREDQDRYEQGLIIFLSKPYSTRLMAGSTRLHMVGFYCNSRKIKGRILDVNVPDYIHSKAKKILKTKKGKGKIELYLETPKEHSSLLDKFIRFDQKEILNGQKLGQNRFYEIEDNITNQLIKYLKEDVINQQSSQIVKNKLNKIINLINKNNNIIHPHGKQLIRKKQIILYGPPGTGKTYVTKKIATEVLSLDI